MKALGFTGTTREFRLRESTYEARMTVQKSRWNSREDVEFTFNLSVTHEPTGKTFWGTRIGDLLPEMVDTWWRVSSNSSSASTAEAVVRALTEFGWPAIQAVLESPGFPADPDERWKRSFPSLYGDDNQPGGPPNNPSAIEARSWSAEETIGKLHDANVFVRILALGEVRNRETTTWNSATKDEVRQCLEHDPHPHVRRNAARVLGLMTGNGTTTDALRAAAREDEDLYVRWSARYALALRDQEGGNPGTERLLHG